MEKMPGFEELNKEEKIEEVIGKPEISEVEIDNASEEKLEKESAGIKNELEQMPAEECEKIGVGFRNFGFFAKELKSQAMAWIFENAGGDKKEAQEAEGFTGSIKRWLNGWAQSYRKDEETARKNIETTKEFDLSLKQVGNVGFITGEAMKYGRTVADVVGWTAGSPLRYAMFGAQFFSRGAEAAKEARLMNTEVIEKTRVKNVDEAAEEAWKIYENAQIKAEEKGGKVSKQDLEKVYVENLPQDLLRRLEKSEPGTATGILQRVLKKDLEFAIKHGKVNEARLKEYDKMISQYGEIDALAIGAKYAETAGKAVVAGVQIETAALLFQRMPEMINKLMELGSSTAYGDELPKEILRENGNIEQKSQFDYLQSEIPKSELFDKYTQTEIPKSDVILEKQPQAIEFEAKVEAPAVNLENEKLIELATIKKGEGIEHALIRQLITEPEKFGFKGNAEDLSAVKSWAGGEAHRIAIENDYVDPKSGAETWVRHSENPTRVILRDDKTIEIEQGQNLYKASSEELKRAAEYRENLGKPKITPPIEAPAQELTPKEMAEMADKGFKEYMGKYSEEYPQRAIDESIKNLAEETAKTPAEKIDESYDQRIAEQERLKEIERAGIREKMEYYDERYNEQERLKEIEKASELELKTFAADLVKEYPKGVKVNINNDALLAMKEREINFKKGELTNIIGDKGKGNIGFEPIDKQITQKIDISKEGDNLLVKITDTDGTIQKLYITDQNRLGIVKEDLAAYKKLAETDALEKTTAEKQPIAQVEETLKKPEVKTEISPEKSIEKPEIKPEIKSEIPEAKSVEMPKSDISEISEKTPVAEQIKGYSPELSTKTVTYEDLAKGSKDIYKKFVFANDRQGGTMFIGNKDNLDLESDLDKIYYNTKIPVDKKIEILSGIKKVLDEEASALKSKAGPLNLSTSRTFELLSWSVAKDIKRLSK